MSTRSKEEAEAQANTPRNRVLIPSRPPAPHAEPAPHGAIRLLLRVRELQNPATTNAGYAFISLRPLLANHRRRPLRRQAGNRDNAHKTATSFFQTSPACLACLSACLSACPLRVSLLPPLSRRGKNRGACTPRIKLTNTEALACLRACLHAIDGGPVSSTAGH